MRTINTDSFPDDDFESYFNYRQRWQRQTNLRRPRQPKRSQAEILAEMVEYNELDSMGAEAVFNPTFGGSRHEHALDSELLGTFL